MRYTVTKQRVEVIGVTWEGFESCMVRDLTEADLKAIGDPRDEVAVWNWLRKNLGDFEIIVDFRADLHLGDEHVVHEWDFPTSEDLFRGE